MLTRSKDRFVFPKGAIIVVHKVTKNTQSFDPGSCPGRFNQQGTFKVISGTGAYAHAQGSGTFALTGYFLGCGKNTVGRLRHHPGQRQALLLVRHGRWCRPSVPCRRAARRQPVLGEQAHGFQAGPDAEFVEDGCDVFVDGPRAYSETGRNTFRRPPVRKQGDDFRLTSSESQLLRIRQGHRVRLRAEEENVSFSVVARVEQRVNGRLAGAGKGRQSLTVPPATP